MKASILIAGRMLVLGLAWTFAVHQTCAATYPNGAYLYSAPPLAVLPSAPPSGIYVPATNDNVGIQAAINAASAAGGGTVQLSSGTYTINTGVVLKSNVFITGAGQGVTFLRRGPSFAYTTGTISPNWVGLLYSNNPAGGIHDVKISALSVDGALSATERAAQWPGFYGIWVESDGSIANHNLRIQLSSVEVKNCGQGFHCKGTTEVTLWNGWYHDNGGGNLYFHNIYFRRAGDITISGVTSKNSGGHGIKFAGGTSNYPNESMNITVTGCDISSNQYTNLYFTGVKGMRVSGNNLNYGASLMNSTVSGGAAVYLDWENSVQCDTGDFINNTVQNSYADGFRVWSTSNLNIQGNRCNGNAANYDVHAANLNCDYNTQ